MEIHIKYESKYSLGTTRNGENVLPSLKHLKDIKNSKGTNGFLSNTNTYYENIEKLNDIYENFIYKDITINTVLGILCRLVGDIRRLDQILLITDHPIVRIKEKISFLNTKVYFQNEMITLHTKEKDDPSSSGGMIIKNSPIMTNNAFSESLLSVFNYQKEQEILDYMQRLVEKDPSLKNESYNKKINLLNFVKEMNNGNKRFQGEPLVKKFCKQFNVVLKKETNFNAYGLLIYEKIKYLNHFKLYSSEINNTLSENNKFSGISEVSGVFTLKDFYKFYVAQKKQSWTLPYSINIKKNFVNPGDNLNYNAKLGVTKEGGELIIMINSSLSEEEEIKNLIINSGVNTFHMGKKGLAYISKIKGNS